MVRFKEVKKSEEKKESKGKKGNKTLTLIISIAAALVLVISLGYIAKYYWDAYNNRRLNADIKKITSSSQVSSTPEKTDSHNLAGLIEKNPDTKAWITIPGTNIDYPVVQTKDNAKYLKVDFNGNNNKDGTIFIDFRNSIDPLSQNLILYGHNMKDGQMFGELEKFERYEGNDYVSFINKNQIIKLDTLKGEQDYKIFSVFVTDPNRKLKGAIDYLNADLSTESKFNAFIKSVMACSFVKSDIEVKPSDKLITLSACDYHYPSTKDEHARLVVMGRLMRDGEGTTTFTKKPDVTFPDYYYTVWRQ